MISGPQCQEAGGGGGGEDGDVFAYSQSASCWSWRLNRDWRCIKEMLRGKGTPGVGGSVITFYYCPSKHHGYWFNLDRIVTESGIVFIQNRNQCWDLSLATDNKCKDISSGKTLVSQEFYGLTVTYNTCATVLPAEIYWNIALKRWSNQQILNQTEDQTDQMYQFPKQTAILH